eukprot:TRINITY_DN4337_c0_g1_i2.p1 TRINITY_DN4337_c0_g1~~TRINITY_DN4337_c0_g1_i2.p1  ORF type:complete len:685 (+),score=200.62 TRINITY_DN4337_c0_g1_i2:45-2099(+)
MAVWVLLLCLCGIASSQQPIPGFRPPAVPLIVMDPYMSIWSLTDSLSADWPKYWPGTIKGFNGFIRIDGNVFRFLGPDSTGVSTNPITQNSVTVFPTQTVYSFSDAGIELNVTFTTPSLTDDYDLLSRPITYITFVVTSIDGKSHSVQIYYDNTAEVAVNTVDELVVWERGHMGPLTWMRIGTSAQVIFGRTGDGVGIDWGYAYIAAETDPSFTTVMTGAQNARSTFVSSGSLPSQDDTRQPRQAQDDWPVLAASWNFNVDSSSSVSKHILFAYDDIYSIDYFGTWMRPYWYHLYNNSGDITELLYVAEKQYDDIISRCDQFDQQLLTQLYKVGGEQYATLGALAYRQTTGGTRLVWNEKEQDIWYFMKEISSDGDVSTVDVIFPASPFFVYFSTDLLKRLLIPILVYGSNQTSYSYNYPWAPHHLGTWPVANILSDQQENMPIEETGNMMMMLAAVAQAEGALPGIYPEYAGLLDAWGRYLVENLPDPGNQLCTDDFEGPIAHDSNLAVKGIVAIDCWAYILDLMGNTTAGDYYHKIASQYAMDWYILANPNNTDHYRLRYDEPGFSLKYNLLYQKILGLTTFDQNVFDMELTYYLDQQLNPYGVPLDNRHPYTKFDWEAWVAAIAPQQSQFAAFINGLYKFADETSSRVPLSDWYDTTNANQQGFQARTVVGGLFAKMVTKP